MRILYEYVSAFGKMMAGCGDGEFSKTAMLYVFVYIPTLIRNRK